MLKGYELVALAGQQPSKSTLGFAHMLTDLTLGDPDMLGKDSKGA